MRKVSLIILLAFVIFLSEFVSAVLLSDQGTDVKEIATGNLMALGNLTIEIYDNTTSGNLIFNQTSTNAIANGSWNVMINPNLEYGKSYWKDYRINGEDLDFDGNERLEFQSPLGLINNASFINFSLINSCSAGSSIRLIYENGSVECELDDSGSGSSNLTNYALKNQSETFEGNITTSQTGFFSWLGSLASRITKLFVQDIDASGDVDIGGNLNVTGNVTASYFIGDGSLLTGISAGTESDPIFVAENSTLWSAINSKLAETDQRYNETTLILSMNTTSNIMSLDFYNKSEIDNLISGINGGNASFNQSLTDTLYYSITNPLNFINHTQASVYNDTTLILTTNSSLWSYINTNEANWLSTYNSTYAAKAAAGNCPAGQVVMNTTSSGVQCIVPPAGSESDPLFVAENASLWIEAKNKYNATYVGCVNNASYLSTYNETYAGCINNASYLSTYNSTYATYAYNQTVPAQSYADAQDVIFNDSMKDYVDAQIAGVSGGNASFNQSLTDSLYIAQSEEANLNVNSSQYWINLSSINETQMENNGGILNILESWFSSLFDSLFGAKTTDDLTQGSTNLYDNRSWNQSLANTLYAPVSVTGDNSSWNQSLANTLYAGIQWNYNQTTPANSYTDSIVSANNASWSSTYNATYTTWAYNQTTPADTYTDTKVGTANLHTHDAKNITSPLWVNKTGDTMTGNLNMSSNNVTSVDCIVFNSGGKICSA